MTQDSSTQSETSWNSKTLGGSRFQGGFKELELPKHLNAIYFPRRFQVSAGIQGATSRRIPGGLSAGRTNALDVRKEHEPYVPR